VRRTLLVLIAACSTTTVAGHPATPSVPAKPAAPQAAAAERWCIQRMNDSDGNLVFVTVNLALHDDAGKSSYPFLVHVNVTTQEQNANGHPTDREAEVLNRVEDGITDQLLGGEPGVFVGRATTKGFRELMYYVRDAARANVILDRLVKSPQERAWEFRIEKDPSWKTVEPLLGDDAQCL
jgi:hypothetical protein